MGWANEKSFSGASDQEIEKYEKEKNLQFGEGWHAYLKEFGHKLDVKLMPLYYGFKSMKRAEMTQGEENEDLDPEDTKIDWLKEIKKAKSHEKASGQIDHSEKNPVLVRTLLETGTIMYSIAEDNEIRICNYDVDRKRLGWCTTFKTIFRPRCP